MTFPRAALLALPTLCLASFGQELRLTPRTNNQHPVLAIGSPAPNFELPGIDDKLHKLADYKAPDRLEVVAELPMTSMLKVDKRALSARAAG